MKTENCAGGALRAIVTGYLLSCAGAPAFSPVVRLAPRGSRRSTHLRSASGEKFDKSDLDPWFLSDDRFSPASLRTSLDTSGFSASSGRSSASSGRSDSSGRNSRADDDEEWLKSDERFSPGGLRASLDRINGTSKKNGSAAPYQFQQRKVEESSTNGFSTTTGDVRRDEPQLIENDVVISPEQKVSESSTPYFVQQLKNKKALMSPWLNVVEVNQYGAYPGESRVGGIRREHRVVKTREVADEDAGPTKYTASQRIASLQSCLIGAVVGMIAVSPITALHHLYDPYLFPSYQGLGQWEWDTLTALLQGGFFAVVYRYSVRDEVETKDLQTIIFMAFVLVRSLVRVHVPIDCTALPLQCDSLEGMDMLGEFSINVVESWALFGTVATAMNSLLERGWIFRFPK